MLDVTDGATYGHCPYPTNFLVIIFVLKSFHLFKAIYNFFLISSHISIIVILSLQIFYLSKILLPENILNFASAKFFNPNKCIITWNEICTLQIVVILTF